MKGRLGFYWIGVLPFFLISVSLIFMIYALIILFLNISYCNQYVYASFSFSLSFFFPFSPFSLFPRFFSSLLPFPSVTIYLITAPPNLLPFFYHLIYLYSLSMSPLLTLPTTCIPHLILLLSICFLQVSTDTDRKRT